MWMVEKYQVMRLILLRTREALKEQRHLRLNDAGMSLQL